MDYWSIGEMECVGESGKIIFDYPHPLLQNNSNGAQVNRSLQYSNNPLGQALSLFLSQETLNNFIRQGEVE